MTGQKSIKYYVYATKEDPAVRVPVLPMGRYHDDSKSIEDRLICNESTMKATVDQLHKYGHTNITISTIKPSKLLCEQYHVESNAIILDLYNLK